MSKRTLYRLKNGIGEWYVLALDPTAAQRALEGVLDRGGYGFNNKRPVTTIEVVCAEIREVEDKPFHLNTNNRLIVVQ